MTLSAFVNSMFAPKSRKTFLGSPKWQYISSQGNFCRFKPNTEEMMALRALSRKFSSKNIRKNG